MYCIDVMLGRAAGKEKGKRWRAKRTKWNKTGMKREKIYVSAHPCSCLTLP